MNSASLPLVERFIGSIGDTPLENYSRVCRHTEALLEPLDPRLDSNRTRTSDAPQVAVFRLESDITASSE
jgi:hypothetical protein